ncbi:Protein argonaute 4A [Dendrobium catenatum]|uniref:Protein argonaute 4A n=1 Tax=Dendrobium catenatum TaxID=906689 RepID=A0A2I0WZ43_9ASPA|nr:Protein argonaute 4A [Dendrobium catenatum]
MPLKSSAEGERKRSRRSYNAKTIKVELSFAAKIPMQCIVLAKRLKTHRKHW